MGFDRFRAKMEARRSMRQSRPSPMLVTLLFFLLTTGISILIGRILFDPTEFVLRYLQLNYALEDILNYLFSQYRSQLIVVALVNLLYNIYSAVMGFGYTSYALRLARDEQPGIGRIFDGFLRFGRVLWSVILVDLLVFLWILPFMAGAVAAAVWYVFGGPELTYTVAYILAVAGAAVGILKSYSYRLTHYFMLDDPSCSARQAATRSKEAMRGWRMDLFMVDMSFLGWAILSTLTAGILLVWLNPYMAATEANFYDWVTGREGEQEPMDGVLPPL